MKVPPPIQKVFDTFPLTQYPPVPNSSPNIKGQLEQNKYYFTSESSDATFLLGVHNLVKTNGKYIPTDPVSLSQCLFLCVNNNLKLPKEDSRGCHAMVKLSNQAAVDKHLPILIETEEGSRTIRSSTAVNSSIQKRLESTQDVLANNLIDFDLYDVWVLCILAEVAPTDISKLKTIFTLDASLASNDTFTKMVLYSLLGEISNWHAFRLRYSTLFDQLGYTSLIDSNPLTDYNLEATQKLYSDKCSVLENKLKSLIDYTKGNEVLQLKLIAFFLSVNETLPETQLGKIVAKFDFLNECYTTLDKF